MKRVLGVLLAAAFIFLLAGCGKKEEFPLDGPAAVGQTVEETTAEVIEEVTEETATELVTKHYDPPVPPETPPKYIATPTYAVSDTYFYGVCSKSGYNFKDEGATLRRVLLSDISKQEEIPLPEKYVGKVLSGIQICGLTEEWLFISRELVGSDYNARNFVTYRVSLKNFEPTTIDEGKYYCRPWYNAASDSLLFGRRNGDNLQIEALQAENDKRNVIWDQPIDGEMCHWQNTVDGMVALDSGIEYYGPLAAVVDKDNRVVPMERGEVNYRKNEDKQPKGETEKSLAKNKDCQTYVAYGNYIYYVQRAEEQNNLYRMHLNGTRKELLRAKTNIYYLFTQKDKLFCLAYRPDPEGINETFMGFYALNGDGKVVSTIAHGVLHDCGYSLWELNELILMDIYYIYGNSCGYFVTLYDPATGAVFSAET